MKQTSFVVEIVLTESTPTIIIRDVRGQIVKVTTDSHEVTSFLEEVVEKLNQIPTISSTLKNS